MPCKWAAPGGSQASQYGLLHPPACLWARLRHQPADVHPRCACCPVSRPPPAAGRLAMDEPNLQTVPKPRAYKVLLSQVGVDAPCGGLNVVVRSCQESHSPQHWCPPRCSVLPALHHHGLDCQGLGCQAGGSWKVQQCATNPCCAGCCSGRGVPPLTRRAAAATRCARPAFGRLSWPRQAWCCSQVCWISRLPWHRAPQCSVGLAAVPGSQLSGTGTGCCYQHAPVSCSRLCLQSILPCTSCNRTTTASTFTLTSHTPRTPPPPPTSTTTIPLHPQPPTPAADYRQVEFRLMAHFSGDAALARIFSDGATDPFRLLAAQWLRLAPEQVGHRD